MPCHAQADVFSLGAVLWALLCSNFPKMLALRLGQAWHSIAQQSIGLLV